MKILRKVVWWTVGIPALLLFAFCLLVFSNDRSVTAKPLLDPTL